ncbi:MAG: dihydrofolate reductase family protein [Candidatus Limnocylindrales bacterium]
MGRLIYLLNVSLDGFVETADKALDWTVIDDELHQWFNEQMRMLEASLYGRGLYETMSSYWPTAKSDPNATPIEREFADIWLDMPKIVFSRSLDSVDWNSRLVRDLPAEALGALRKEFKGDMDVGGATLAASFIKAGLVDEFGLVVHPVAIGSGTPYFPEFSSPTFLRLIETKRFESGVVYLRYGRHDE